MGVSNFTLFFSFFFEIRYEQGFAYQLEVIEYEVDEALQSPFKVTTSAHICTSAYLAMMRTLPL